MVSVNAPSGKYCEQHDAIVCQGFGFRLEPISGNDRTAPYVISGPKRAKIIISILLPRFSLNH